MMSGNGILCLWFLMRSAFSDISSDSVVWSEAKRNEYPFDRDKRVFFTQKPHWNYEPKGAAGPSEWYRQHKDCGGHYQSPMAFWQEDLVVDETLPPFELIGYDSDLQGLQMENNGHTVKIEFNSSQHNVKIGGGGLEQDTYYRLAQIHFHWGANDDTGSEHTLGNNFYPFEMHVVHIKGSLSLADALKQSQGLAVLGVFFEHSDVDNNTALIPLIEVMHQVKEKGGKVRLNKPIKPRDLLPVDVSNFFRYQGSLTTPPCSEVVTWTVFVDAHPITTLQIQKFRSVSTKDKVDLPADADETDLEGRLLFNHRPIQEPHERKVSIRKKLKCSLPSKSTASGIFVPSHLLISVGGVMSFAYWAL